MTDTGSSPFAEPDFSSLHTSEDEQLPPDAYSDEAADDSDELDEEVVVSQAATEDAPQDGDLDDAGNRVAGGTARSVLEHLARSIVDEPEGVTIDVGEARGGLRLALHVAQGDMGRIIGRRGRTAQALRTLVRAAAARDGQEASVDIVD
jgi:predicted RNA-binding protein YlqC (UPF0109 family)